VLYGGNDGSEIRKKGTATAGFGKKTSNTDWGATEGGGNGLSGKKGDGAAIPLRADDGDNLHLIGDKGGKKVACRANLSKKKKPIHEGGKEGWICSSFSTKNKKDPPSGEMETMHQKRREATFLEKNKPGKIRVRGR